MKTLAIAIFSVFWLQSPAQQFLIPIWFEDSIGNKDTIWVGGDPNAVSDNLNPQFGEVEITTPFDSVFEVRVVHGDDSQWRTCKKVIEHNEPTIDCYLGAGTRIIIHAIHWPIKVTWDNSLLLSQYPCNINMVLTPDTRVFLLQYWWQARKIYCMMAMEEITEDFSYIDDIEDSWLLHEFEVEGQGLKKLLGYYFVGHSGYPYCYTVDAPEAPPTSDGLLVAPNPFASELELQFSTPVQQGTGTLYDLSGRAVAHWAVEGHTARCALDVPPGVYILEVAQAGQPIMRRKVVRMDE